MFILMRKFLGKNVVRLLIGISFGAAGDVVALPIKR